MTETLAPPAPVAAPEPSLSIGERIVAVFTRPSKAWGGLETRVQWWVPVLILLLVQLAGSQLIYDRAMMPMLRDQFDEQVANGTMGAQQAERAEDMMSGPVGRAFMVVPFAVFPLVAMFVTALGVVFGVGFLLGGKLRYRLALETVAWSSLVNVVGVILFLVLAWSRESLQGVHIGFGAFLPEPETPNKLSSFLTGVLDGIGPFAIWSLAVMILGASTLSGKPRKPVALVLSAIYLVLVLFFSGLGAMFSRGA